MMLRYKPELIYEYGERLYKKAGTIVAIYTVIGLIIGLFLLAGTVQAGYPVIGFGLVIILTIIGNYIGNEKAFWVKLQAQISLCQVKIEENTVRISEVLGGGSSIPIIERKPHKNIVKPSKSLKSSCPECFAELKVGASFCEDCGFKIS